VPAAGTRLVRRAVQPGPGHPGRRERVAGGDHVRPS